MTVVHLEAAAGDWNAPVTAVVMRCGLTVYLDENGAGMPEGHDFVAPGGRAEITCAGCLVPSVGKTSSRGLSSPKTFAKVLSSPKTFARVLSSPKDKAP